MKAAYADRIDNDIRVAEMTEDAVLDVLRQVTDPEVGINIVDLGLVYGVTVDEESVTVDMTMTTPACPLHTYLTGETERVIRQANPGLRRVTVDLVWQPAWTPMMMSWRARALLGDQS